jgi:hypothetical protein
MNNQSTQHRDLFEYYDEQPPNLRKITDKYLKKHERRNLGYDGLTEFHNKVYEIGYTFDFGLDAEPYGLRPIGVELHELKGWENIND